MKIERFEDLDIYKKAMEIANNVYAITRSNEFSRDFALRDQIRKSVISMISNIAEGFERESDAEFAQFLFIAKGSCGEARAQLNLALDQKYLDNKKYQEVYEKLISFSKMTSTLIKYLRK